MTILFQADVSKISNDSYDEASIMEGLHALLITAFILERSSKYM